MFKDVLATMDLSMAPIVALLAFFAGFVGVLAWLAFTKEREHFSHMNELPLHDGAIGVSGTSNSGAIATGEVQP